MSKFHVLGVDHLGVACADLDEGSKFWAECMGVPCSGKETVDGVPSDVERQPG